MGTYQPISPYPRVLLGPGPSNMPPAVVAALSNLPKATPEEAAHVT